MKRRKQRDVSGYALAQWYGEVATSVLGTTVHGLLHTCYEQRLRLIQRALHCSQYQLAMHREGLRQEGEKQQ